MKFWLMCVMIMAVVSSAVVVSQNESDNFSTYNNYIVYINDSTWTWISGGAGSWAYEPNGNFTSYELTSQPTYIYIGPDKVLYSDYMALPLYSQTNHLWIQGEMGWSRRIMAPQGSVIWLLAYTPMGGVTEFYKVHSEDPVEVRSSPIPAGYSHMAFFADQVGRYSIYFIKEEMPSEIVIIDVYPTGETPQTPIYLSDFRTYRATSSIWYDTNAELKMGNIEYCTGIKFKTLDTGVFDFNLNGQFSILTGLIGLDDSSPSSGKISVEFYGDDKLLKKFQLQVGDLPRELNIDVSGVRRLSVRTERTSSWWTTYYIDLADPVLR